MSRVTEKMLEAQVDQMNLDLPAEKFHKLAYAYGGVKLMVRQPKGGFIDALYCGYIPKRDLSNRIDAYERGMQL